MKQVHFHSKICIICKSTERVDGGMNDDAGKQASSAVKNRDQQETYCNRKDDLAQIAD